MPEAQKHSTDTDNTEYDHLVVIPTVATPDTLVPAFERLLRHLDGQRVHLVLSVNPVDQDAADHAVRGVLAAWDACDDRDGSRLTVHREAGPVGFARACNLGLLDGAREGLPGTVVLLNDDVRVTSGWLTGLRSALDTRSVRVWGEVTPPGVQKPERDVAGYGRVGLAGPCTDLAAGTQQVDLSPRGKELLDADLDQYAYHSRQANPGNVETADFLSGFCLALDRACVRDLLDVDDAGSVTLLDERFNVGGFEDNDLMVRAEAAGWRAVVTYEVFVRHVGHQSLDRYFPGQQRGLANRLVYYEKWAARPTGRRLVAVMRVGLTFVQDIVLWRAAVSKLGGLVDGLAVLLTQNPLEVLGAWDKSQAGVLRPEDREWLQACGEATPAEVAAATQRWLQRVLIAAPRHVDVVVEDWHGELNERTERNAAAAMAYRMGADWVLSVDHDEVVENRVTRETFDRLMSHPDPLVRSWDFGWLTHWETPRLIRVDRPWAAPDYSTSMRGFRLWRANRDHPRGILAGNPTGLHCGNCPDFDITAKRVSGVRFRHFGYLRHQDRVMKQARYQRIDSRPDAALVGPDGYSHLTSEEGMVLSPYVERNGVALTMLWYSGESVEDLARWLDYVYGVVDRVVLVWTGEWDPDDATSGPSPDVRRVAELFGAEWVVHELDDDLAACRNAALDHVATDTRVGWAWVVDPDEWVDDPFSVGVAVRRMAESSESWGFMVEFLNHNHPETNRPATVSENVRFLRLDEAGTMRFGGRVHEGFSHSLEAMRARGQAPRLLYAPWRAHNRGLALDDEAMERKIRRYQELLLLQLAEDDCDAGSWVSLALQYFNDGREADGQLCLDRACVVAGHSYLPYKERALRHLRLAKRDLVSCLDRLSPQHKYHRIAEVMLEWVVKVAPEQPLVGSARTGRPRPEAMPDPPPFRLSEALGLGGATDLDRPDEVD